MRVKARRIISPVVNKVVHDTLTKDPLGRNLRIVVVVRRRRRSSSPPVLLLVPFFSFVFTILTNDPGRIGKLPHESLSPFSPPPPPPPVSFIFFVSLPAPVSSFPLLIAPGRA